jgi:hypothetical protein
VVFRALKEHTHFKNHLSSNMVSCPGILESSERLLMSDLLACGCTMLVVSVCSHRQNWLLLCENVVVLQLLTIACVTHKYSD